MNYDFTSLPETRVLKLTEIKPNPDNPRKIEDDQKDYLKESLTDFSPMYALRNIVVNEDNMILGGNQRYDALLAEGVEEVRVGVFTKEMSKEINRRLKKAGKKVKTYEGHCKEMIVKDNLGYGTWEYEILKSIYDIEELASYGMNVTPMEDWDFPEIDHNATPPEPKNILKIEFPDRYDVEDITEYLLKEFPDCVVKA